jgi:hypothetical protein
MALDDRIGYRGVPAGADKCPRFNRLASQRNRILVKKQKSKNFVILATLVVVLVFYLLQREIQLGDSL